MSFAFFLREREKFILLYFEPLSLTSHVNLHLIKFIISNVWLFHLIIINISIICVQ